MQKLKYTLLASVILIGWIVIFCLHIDYTLQALPRTDSISIDIEPSTSVGEIGDLLEQKGLIRDSMFFRVYAFAKDYYVLKSGNYIIPPNYDLDQILLKMKNGDQDFRKVDIPPGWTIVEIAARLSSNGYDGRGFLTAVRNRKPVYAFEKDLLLNPGKRKYALEGYLAPGTYYFKPDETPEKLVSLMVDRFSEMLIKLDVENKLKQSSTTLDQVLNVASLVEREGYLPEEMPRIAGVIYNRLKSTDNNKLRIDATTVYFKTVKEGQKYKDIKKSDNKIEDPFNTYLNVGLPPGPISTISEAAILAALSPEGHTFQYYVSAYKGSKKHLFASTHAEHKKNIDKSNSGSERTSNS